VRRLIKSRAEETTAQADPAQSRGWTQNHPISLLWPLVQRQVMGGGKLSTFTDVRL
jgi:hypothetical protein